jgi:hypothetical protein
MASNIELRNAWFAGFYEGEGWVSNDKSNSCRLKLGIAQNDETPLTIAQLCWGGSITKRVRKSPASDKICTGYEWNLSHKAALEFISDIRPYMIIPYKINQLERAIERFENPVPTEPYGCAFCDKQFIHCANRRRHERTQHTEKNELFICDMKGCDRKYKTRDTLQRHKRLNHNVDGNETISKGDDETEEVVEYELNFVSFS